MGDSRMLLPSPFCRASIGYLIAAKRRTGPLGHRLRQISCKGNKFFRQRAALPTSFHHPSAYRIRTDFSRLTLPPSVTFELSPSTVHSISSIYSLLSLFMVDSKKEETYAVYYRLWIVWKCFGPDIWPFRSFSLSTPFPRFYPQAKRGRKVGAIRLGEHGRLFHPHPVDKWMGMKKTWKSDSHFCGNRQGQAVQIVVNSWIARWRLIGLALKSCPQCFPRLFNTL